MTKVNAMKKKMAEKIVGSYTNLPIKTAGDKKVCAECQARASSNKGKVPPMHKNCRCGV